jgi:hypothetical protein
VIKGQKVLLIESKVLNRKRERTEQKVILNELKVLNRKRTEGSKSTESSIYRVESTEQKYKAEKQQKGVLIESKVLTRKRTEKNSRKYY